EVDHSAVLNRELRSQQPVADLFGTGRAVRRLVAAGNVRSGRARLRRKDSRVTLTVCKGGIRAVTVVKVKPARSRGRNSTGDDVEPFAQENCLGGQVLDYREECDDGD